MKFSTEESKNKFVYLVNVWNLTLTFHIVPALQRNSKIYPHKVFMTKSSTRRKNLVYLSELAILQQFSFAVRCPVPGGFSRGGSLQAVGWPPATHSGKITQHKL
jgi:hypothetical protein